MNWFKRKHDYYVTFIHKSGYGSTTFTGIKIFNKLEFPKELKRVVEESNDAVDVVILSWVRL